MSGERRSVALRPPCSGGHPIESGSRDVETPLTEEESLKRNTAAVAGSLS